METNPPPSGQRITKPALSPFERLGVLR